MVSFLAYGVILKVGCIMDKLEDLSTLLQAKRAKAMLELFKADCGRAAVTLNEIKDWACAQQENELRSRVERRVSRDMRTDANQEQPDGAALKKQLPTISPSISKSLMSLLIGGITVFLLEARQKKTHKRGHAGLEGRAA
jgi:hypothetical protein